MRAPALASGYSCRACKMQTSRWPGSACPECGGKMQLGAPELESAKVHALGEGIVLSSRKPTCVEPIDRVIGGGTLPGFVYLMSGAPSAGKTSLLLSVLTNAEKPLMVNGEQPEEDVLRRARDLEIDASRIRWTQECDVLEVCKLVLLEEPTDVVIDSLDCLYESGRLPGGAWTKKEAMRRIFDLAHRTGIHFWIVCHVNKRKGAAGPESVVHWCDAHLYVDVQKHGQRTLIGRKVRGAPTGVTAKLETKACDVKKD